MYLPNAEQAIVEERKLVDYLLNAQHPDGGPKAAYFLKLGYSLDRPNDLRQDILYHARTCDVSETIRDKFGTKYVVEGSLGIGHTSVWETPNLIQTQHIPFRSIWRVYPGTDIPKLVTAYRIDKK